MPRATMNDMVKFTPEQEAAILPQKRRVVPSKRPSEGKRHPAIWVIIGVFAVGAIVSVASNLFARATVVVIPHSEAVTLDHNATAVRGGGNGQIQFETMTLAVSDTKSVPATGKEKVEKKATGKIVVYNNYSTKAQKLVKGTRFKAVNGKVYRADSDFTVPGITKQNGQSVPGSIEIPVTADAAGESYNQGRTDFTIPGFVGSPKYEKFYGRSGTDMVGGFVGEMNVASQKDVDTARTELRTELTDRVRREALTQVPEQYVAYPPTFVVVFSDTYGSAQGATSTAGDVVSIKGTAQLRGVVFKTEDLTRYVAEQSPTPYDGSPVVVPDLASLEMVINNGVAVDYDIVTTLGFHAKGEVHVVSKLDETKIAEALAGTSKDDRNVVFSKFAGIDRADTTFLPAWVRSFPDNPNRITVRIEGM